MQKQYKKPNSIKKFPEEFFKPVKFMRRNTIIFNTWSIFFLVSDKQPSINFCLTKSIPFSDRSEPGKASQNVSYNNGRISIDCFYFWLFFLAEYDQKLWVQIAFTIPRQIYSKLFRFFYNLKIARAEYYRTKLPFHIRKVSIEHNSEEIFLSSCYHSSVRY